MAVLTAPARPETPRYTVRKESRPAPFMPTHIENPMRVQVPDRTTPIYPSPPPDLSGKYSWIVTQNGVPVSGHQVGIFYRPNMRLVEMAISDSSGFFQFENLIPDDPVYFICALDKAGAPFQNAIIYDYIQAPSAP